MDQVSTPERLNEGLCPEQFKICVPKASTLLRKPWGDEKRWKHHVRHLKHAYDLTGDVEIEDCWTCDGKPGWRLRGEYAVAHAREVHEQIHRQVLGLEQVSAIDVGFAIWERRNRFGDFLAIRVHVNRKQPPEQLAKQGLASFTQPSFLVNHQRGLGADGGAVASGGPVSPIDGSSTIRGGGVGEFGARAARGGKFRTANPLANRLGIKRRVTGDSALRISESEEDAPSESSPQNDESKHCGSTVGNPAPGTEGRCESEEGEVVDCCLPCPDPQRGLDSVADRKAHIGRLFADDFRQNPRLWQTLSRYPIGGVRIEDFSAFCPLPIEETERIEQVRVCIGGVPIDIINAQYRPAVAHPGGDAQRGVFVDKAKRNEELTPEESLFVGRGRVSPLVGGVSIGSVTDQAGTLGTIVWDQTDGTPCILGNWHVLAGSPSARVGQPIYQPAIFDGGSEDDVVAQLKRWHLGSRGDAALAELNHNRAYAAGQILGLWAPVSGYLAPKLNMEVRKSGRTTGFTEGFVDGIALATNIDYGNGAIRFFRDQFHIAPLEPGLDVSQTGDSGSIVVTSFEPEQQGSSGTCVGE